MSDIKPVNAAHIVVDANMHVFAVCADDAPDKIAFVQEHFGSGDKVYRVSKKMAKELIYTTLPAGWPRTINA